jgi:hypothetical protein
LRKEEARVERYDFGTCFALRKKIKSVSLADTSAAEKTAFLGYSTHLKPPTVKGNEYFSPAIGPNCSTWKILVRIYRKIGQTIGRKNASAARRGSKRRAKSRLSH